MTEIPAVEFDFDHFRDMAFRQKWLILAVWGVVFGLSMLVIATSPSVYDARCLVLIEKERGAGGIYTNNGTTIENKNEDYYQTQYRLIKSYSLLEKIHRDLDLNRSPEFAGPYGVDILIDAVKTIPVPRSRLVNIEVSSTDPENAARIANAIAQTFVSENLANQLFISKDILQAIQATQGTPRARRLYESLPTVVSNTLIQALKSEHAKLELQAAEMAQQVTERHPARIELNFKLAAVRRQIDEEMERVVGSLKAELSGQLRGNNVRIVDPARVPTYPSRPRRGAIGGAGAVGGLLLGILLAYVFETADTTLRREKDVEQKLGLPFLGFIPAASLKGGERLYQNLIAQESNLSAESVRNLRTMVDFAAVGEWSRFLLITSTLQEEGKTSVASCLAVAYCQMGERVLIIDGDLRRPALHTRFGLSREKGLSQFLASGHSTDELAPLIQRHSVENLHALVCGVRPPNPSELLNTPRVAALISWARKNYDRVIVDCPPMFPINDTLLWAKHSPGVVLVARHGSTKVSLIQAAAQKLAGVGGLKILGLTLNAARMSSMSYSQYGHYYRKYADGEKKAAASSAA